MKFIVVLLLALAPIVGTAKSVSKKLADKVVNDLTNTWTFGIDSISGNVDIEAFNQFKALFDENATVSDDLNIRLKPGKDSGGYMIVDTIKDFDVYAHDAALEVIKIRIDTIVMTGSGEQAVYEIRRTVYVEKPAKYVLHNTEGLSKTMFANHTDLRFDKKNRKKQDLTAEVLNSLRENLRKDPDSIFKFNVSSTLRVEVIQDDDSLHPVRIKSIRQLSSTVTCLNDVDGDGVLDRADSLSAVYGDVTAQGAPDDDLDGVPDEYDRCRGMYGSRWNQGCPESYFTTNSQLEATVGIQFNDMNIGLPALDELGYQFGGADAMDVLQSQKGNLSSTAFDAGVYIGGSYAWFFGSQKRKAGISIGVFYSRFVTEYELDDPIRYTYKSEDPNGDLYRRQIEIGSMSEMIKYDLVNIPLQFNYRFRIKGLSNWAFMGKAGPSLLLMNGNSDYNATIDVGGIYQVDENDKLTYYNPFDPNSDRNVYFTTEKINSQSSSPGAEEVFDRMNSLGYDFASNKEFRGEQKISRTSFALNFSFEVQYKICNCHPWGFKAGVHCTYAPTTAATDDYKAIERTTEGYNSIFNSSGDSYYFGYGINVGVVYDF